MGWTGFGGKTACRPSQKSEGPFFLRCSTAWCISSHEVVYFGVRPVLVWRYENPKNKIVCQNRKETSFGNGDFERGFSL